MGSQGPTLLHVVREDSLSDCVDVQAELSFPWTHHFVYFAMLQLICIKDLHTCHNLWDEANFKGFSKTFTKLTLELHPNNHKPLYKCKKLAINTTKCDLCLFLHKMCGKMVWKFCEIWKILWELAFRWAKFCEILSHSVRNWLWDMACMDLFDYIIVHGFMRTCGLFFYEFLNLNLWWNHQKAPIMFVSILPFVLTKTFSTPSVTKPRASHNSSSVEKAT